MFKVFERRSVERVGAFRIWHGIPLWILYCSEARLFERFEEFEERKFEESKESATVGEKKKGKWVEGRSETLAHKNQYYNNIN